MLSVYSKYVLDLYRKIGLKAVSDKIVPANLDS